MLKKITINNVATYKQKISIEPNRLNFFYGTNGSGKSTLAKILSDPINYPECNIEWENGNPVEICVYNKKYIDDNFSESKRIDGIFTLGKSAKETIESIAELKLSLDNAELSKSTLDKEITELNAQCLKKTEKLKNQCWKAKDTLNELSNALAGYNGSKEKFMQYCLKRHTGINETSVQITGEELQKIYDAAYNYNIIAAEKLIPIDIVEFINTETSELLKKKIEGHADTDIAGFIRYLSNSDWVHKGIDYLVKSDGRCPYCHQILPDNIKNDIENFFDNEYSENLIRLKQLKADYFTKTSEMLNTLNQYVDSEYLMEYTKEYKDKLKILKNYIDNNNKIIDEKISSPSAITELESIHPVILQINEIINKVNIKIEQQNEVVNNRNNIKKNFPDKLVDYLLMTGLKDWVETYYSECSNLKSDIKGKEQNLKEINENIAQYKQEISQKEQTIISVVPTVNKINRILTGVGFSGFRIAENESEKGTYKLVRDDNTYVENTLSEGEKNFLSFLYFICSIHSKTTPVIVVIDDPVSSMDSNVLFIVASLTRDILEKCKKDNTNQPSNIKQILILTHNVYFHKEITSNYTRDEKVKGVTYWVVRKSNGVSKIDCNDLNPIRTTYELLWDDVRNSQENPQPTILNTLRRIIEFYFKLTGSNKYRRYILGYLDDEDKILCQAIIEGLHSGSHDIADDIMICYDEQALLEYLVGFKRIFEKTNQISHYNMMMHIGDGSDSTAE